MKTISKTSQKSLGKNLEMFAKLPSAKRVTLGGGLRSHAKRARPIAPRSTVHLVLKSSKARGRLSFLNPANKHVIQAIIKKQAKKYYVRIDQYANVGNHLHIKVYLQATEEFRNFLRSITCLIARHVTGARRGKKFGTFWDALAFTRILKTFTEHQVLERYIFANIAEGETGKNGRSGIINMWYGNALSHAPPGMFA
jgi:REP element-mobilizing transposase RayT